MDHHTDHPSEAAFPQPLIDAFRRQPDVPAFEHRGRAVTRAESLAAVRACGRALRRVGLGPGASVAVATGVTPDAFALLIAAYLHGCRVVGLRPGLTRHQLRQVLAADTDAVLVDGQAPPDVLAAAAAHGRRVLHLDTDLLGDHHDTAGDGPGPDGAADLPTAQGRPDDTALIHLTSGSTGSPKGCAVSYRGLTANWAWQPARWTRRTADLAAGYRRFLLFGTLTSAVIFEHLALCLLGGGTAVIPDPPLAFPQVFERHRITACLMTVPRLYAVLDALRAEPTDTSSLRALLVAGSPLAPHRLAEAADRLGPVVYQGYGQTETGMLTLLTPDDLADRSPSALSSVGHPMDGVRISVRDTAGTPVPDGRTGEIWVRTDSAMTGYVGDPEQTREVLRDGWIHTRDAGHLDRQGRLHLTGRSRDVIIINAVVHYAGAMEQALASHPHVDQAYVVGAPDEATGEAAHAFVVPAAGHAPDLPALREHVATRLGPAGVPATLTVIDEVPVAPSGKPDKKALLDAAARRS